MAESIQSFIDGFSFICELKGIRLASITSAEPEQHSFVITNEASLNFENENQIVVQSSYYNTSLLFFEEEDVLLDIRKEMNYEVISNTEPSTPICSILVDEIPSSYCHQRSPCKCFDSSPNPQETPTSISGGRNAG